MDINAPISKLVDFDEYRIMLKDDIIDFMSLSNVKYINYLNAADVIEDGPKPSLDSAKAIITF